MLSSRSLFLCIFALFILCTSSVLGDTTYTRLTMELSTSLVSIFVGDEKEFGDEIIREAFYNLCGDNTLIYYAISGNEGYTFVATFLQTGDGFKSGCDKDSLNTEMERLQTLAEYTVSASRGSPDWPDTIPQPPKWDGKSLQITKLTQSTISLDDSCYDSDRRRLECVAKNTKCTDVLCNITTRCTTDNQCAGNHCIDVDDHKQCMSYANSAVVLYSTVIGTIMSIIAIIFM